MLALCYAHNYAAAPYLLYTCTIRIHGVYVTLDMIFITKGKDVDDFSVIEFFSQFEQEGTCAQIYLQYGSAYFIEGD